MQTGDIYSADLLALTTCCGKRSGNCKTSDYWNQVQGNGDGNSQDECIISFAINQSINQSMTLRQETSTINPSTFSGYYVYRLI